MGGIVSHGTQQQQHDAEETGTSDAEYHIKSRKSFLSRMKSNLGRRISNINIGNVLLNKKQDHIGFPEIVMPLDVKKIAEQHAKFLVALHHISSFEKVDGKEADLQRVNLQEKSWPMYFIDNIKIRKICNVSISIDKFGQYRHINKL